MSESPRSSQRGRLELEPTIAPSRSFSPPPPYARVDQAQHGSAESLQAVATMGHIVSIETPCEDELTNAGQEPALGKSNSGLLPSSLFCRACVRLLDVVLTERHRLMRLEPTPCTGRSWLARIAITAADAIDRVPSCERRCRSRPSKQCLLSSLMSNLHERSSTVPHGLQGKAFRDSEAFRIFETGRKNETDSHGENHRQHRCRHKVRGSRC